MNINNAYPTTFGMKISPQLKTELKDSIPQNDLKKINKLINLLLISELILNK